MPLQTISANVQGTTQLSRSPTTSVCLFGALFGEGAHARSIVAEASGMARKIVRRTSFEATRDLAT